MARLRRIGSFASDSRGQAATEYILVIAMISIPLYVAVKFAFELFIEDMLTALIRSFTRG